MQHLELLLVPAESLTASEIDPITCWGSRLQCCLDAVIIWHSCVGDGQPRDASARLMRSGGKGKAEDLLQVPPLRCELPPLMKRVLVDDHQHICRGGSYTLPHTWVPACCCEHRLADNAGRLNSLIMLHCCCIAAAAACRRTQASTALGMILMLGVFHVGCRHDLPECFGCVGPQCQKSSHSMWRPSSRLGKALIPSWKR